MGTTMKSIILLLLACLVIFTGCKSEAPKNIEGTKADKIRVILDSDANNELDDQHAIAYMLFNREVFDVEGITVNKTHNGGSIDEHFAEAERVVKLCGLDQEIKIYKGATEKYEDIVKSINEPTFDGSEAVDFIIKQANMQDDRKLVLLPVGKLTNIALALKKDPSIASKVRIVWLGTNYPEPGEYNFVNDIPSIDPILESNVEFEMVMVRYGKPTGTDAVAVSLKEIRQVMPGRGPKLANPVIGRHGGSFTNFGDYSVSLFANFREDFKTRPLFDMAAVAIVKNSAWADRVVISAPKFVDEKWVEQPDNPRKIVIWENFDKDSIMQDFYKSMDK